MTHSFCFEEWNVEASVEHHNDSATTEVFGQSSCNFIRNHFYGLAVGACVFGCNTVDCRCRGRNRHPGVRKPSVVRKRCEVPVLALARKWTYAVDYRSAHKPVRVRTYPRRLRIKASPGASGPRRFLHVLGVCLRRLYHASILYQGSDNQNYRP